ncbi:MAG: DUF4440 domain-containing protein [Pseudomonadales bacterium]|nr:DUF4440 domain-containing protein [Pseudomonadales bacterium]
MSGYDPYTRPTTQASRPGFGPADGVQDIQRAMVESICMWSDLWRLGLEAWMGPFTPYSKPTVADDPETVRAREENAIRAQYAKCQEAFGRRDAKATASYYAPSVVQWNESQMETVGRDKVEQNFATLFQLPDLEAQYAAQKLELSPLADQACEFGRLSVKYSADPKIKLKAYDWTGRYMVVWQKIDGQWLMTFDMTNSLPK